MIFKIVSIAFLAFFITTSCNKDKKLAKLDGNSKVYTNTPLELEETIYIKVPNTVLPFSLAGWGACQSLGIFGPINYQNIIETQNPNPYAHLVRNIRPISVLMELTSVESCDFSMLDDRLELVICNHNFTTDSTFKYRDPLNPSAYYNAVKLGYYSNQNGTNNAFDNSGSTRLELVLEEDVLLDQFIAQGLFNLHMKMKVDKAFTDDFAIIKTVMRLSAELDNKE